MYKKIIFLWAFLLLNSIAFSQASLNSTAKKFLQQISNTEKYAKTQSFVQLCEEYDLIKKDDIYYIPIIALVDGKNINKKELLNHGVLINSQLQELWSMQIPIKEFKNIVNINGVKYIELGNYHTPLLDLALPSARVDSVHYGLGGLSKAYKGSGVIVAIIDWGFDYTHPNFYDTTFTNLRISRAWDQNKNIGTPPKDYSYGAEYIGQDALLDAGSDTLYIFGPMSHGTHVAGISAGTGGGTKYRGVAYNAELVLVSLKLGIPSLLDAFSYISNYASLVNKPFVVNMSFGSHNGAHDGSTLDNMAIDILNGPGKIFVGAAGNNGMYASNFHLDKNFSQSTNDTLKTVVGFTSNIDDLFGQTLVMWGSHSSDFAVALRLVDNNYNILYETPFFDSKLEPFVHDTIVIGTDSLIYIIESDAKHFLNGRPNITIDVKKTGGKKLVLMAVSKNTHLHLWNIVRQNSNGTNWGSPLYSSYPGAVAGDNYYGLAEPGGVGENVITVGSYRSEVQLPNNNTMLYGNISPFSSFGPTVDERMKPDISSTGQNVLSSVNSFDNSILQYLASVDFNGKTYGFVEYSGTSMSCPMVTGIVALMLEAYPKLTPAQAKEILKITARLDKYTGEIATSGHLQWGWGKANALGAVKLAETLNNVQDIEISSDLFSIFPNPAKDFVHIVVNEHSSVKTIEVFDLQGKLIASECASFDIDVSNFDSGFYLVRVQTDKFVGVQRLIISK